KAAAGRMEDGDALCAAGGSDCGGIESDGDAGSGGIAGEFTVDYQRIADYAGVVSTSPPLGVDGCRDRGADRGCGGVGAGGLSGDYDGGWWPGVTVCFAYD